MIYCLNSFTDNISGDIHVPSSDYANPWFGSPFPFLPHKTGKGEKGEKERGSRKREKKDTHTHTHTHTHTQRDREEKQKCTEGKESLIQMLAGSTSPTVTRDVIFKTINVGLENIYKVVRQGIKKMAWKQGVLEIFQSFNRRTLNFLLIKRGISNLWHKVIFTSSSSSPSCLLPPSLPPPPLH